MNAKRARPVDDPKALVPFGWAPGDYHCAACAMCGEAHSGSDKRSIRCQDCAETLRDAPTAMTHLLTPREKVAFKQPCEHCQRMTTVDLTALASGSGDHAELAMKPSDVLEALRADRLPECSFDDGKTWEIDGVGVAETFSRAADALEALLAENAALRAKIRTEIKLSVDNYVSATARATEAERKLAEAVERSDDLLKALEWYGEQARLARLIHSEGDAGRHALADDGGSRARAFIANHETIRINAWLSKEAERG